MKRPTQSPSWLPAILHLAHGLIAGGAGYMLAYAGVIYSASGPGSVRSNVAVFATIGLAVFEIAFFAYVFLRRRKMRRLWGEANECLKRERFEEAEIALTQLLGYAEYKLAPQPVLFALGSCAEGQGDERRAMVLYRRCGDFVPSLRAIGMLQLARGLNQSAAEALRKIVARHPGDLFSVVGLSLALFRSGARESAARELERALKRRPKSEMLRVNLWRVQSGDEPGFDLTCASSGE